MLDENLRTEKISTRGTQGQGRDAAKRGGMLLTALLVLMFFSGTSMFAQVQATGTISGHITDASGASMPKVQVVITEQQTGVSTTMATNSS